MLRVIIRAAQRHSSLIEQHCGVSGAQLWVLQEVHERPGLRIRDVAERLAIQQATASNLVDGLVKKACIDKLRDPDDLRATKLVLTKHGKTVLECAPVHQKGLLPDALAKLNDDQLLHLVKGLHALLLTIDDQDYSTALMPLPFTL